jgi:hypothetical protein
MHSPTLFLPIALFLSVLAGSHAAPIDISVPLYTPKFESLQTSITTTGGVVEVDLQIKYDLAGTARLVGTLDGIVVSGKATIKTTVGSTTYKFSVRSATAPPIVVNISGRYGSSTASCSYTGPKGRANIPENPVGLQASAPTLAAIQISPLVNEKNVVTGTAQISSEFTTNPVVAGTVKGKVSSDLISLAIKHDKRSAMFTGRRVGNAYIGDLRLTIPPARETLTNVSLALDGVYVASGSANFRGAVSQISNRVPVPAPGTTVTVRSDVNGDGNFLGKEIVTTVTDQNGRYQLNAAVVRGRKVLLEIRRPGYAEILQSSPSISPGTIVTKNATLQPLEELPVVAGSAESPDGSIRLDGLPAEIESVSARLFDPTTEAAQFPGPFADNQGNLLVSSVFSTVEATDGSGRAVTNLGAEATLCMKVPPTTWATMGDLVPANNQIDIPLYFYDENAGQWKRHSDNGWLENAGRSKIAEDQLGAIRAGTYLGEIFAVGPVSHLSWWNIDWPISSHTCIKGLLLDTNGTPVSGASVAAVGLTYSGRTGPEITGPDGKFCLEIMRSEADGEDVDGDNILGETQKLQLKVASGSDQYAFGPFTSPVASATCTNGSGLDVGSLYLDAAHRFSVSFCTVTGRVVYSGVAVGINPGTPPGSGIRFAQVVGYDTDALLAAGENCTNCQVSTTYTDSLGYFSLEMPILSGASIFAFANISRTNGYGVFVGERTTIGCPPGLVTIEADYFHLGIVTIVLYKGSDLWGSATLQDNAMVVISYPVGSLYYIGSRNSVGLPTQLGPWVNFPMRNNSPGTYIGSIYFTITSLSPAGGTWEIKGGSVNVSGTWFSTSPFP